MDGKLEDFWFLFVFVGVVFFVWFVLNEEGCKFCAPATSKWTGSRCYWKVLPSVFKPSMITIGKFFHCIQKKE